MCKNINKLPDVLLISASDQTFSNNFVSSIQTGSSLEEPSDPPEVNLTNILRAAFSLIIFLNTLKGLDVLRRRPLQTSKKTPWADEGMVGWGGGGGRTQISIVYL